MNYENRIKSKDGISNIKIVVSNEVNKPFWTRLFRAFRLEKPVPIQGLTIEDFVISEAIITCVTEHENGYYTFTIYNEVSINIDKQN